MRTESHSDRINAILMIHQELKLAALKADEFKGTRLWSHMTWHYFMNYLELGSDVHLWADQIEQDLMPLIMRASDEDENWFFVLQKLLPLVRGLRLLTVVPPIPCVVRGCLYYEAIEW